MAATTEQSPERLDPDEHSGGLIVAEHRGRYLWAAQFAAGRTVLDAGCGTGYGTRILAEAGASRVCGIDISESAVVHASRETASEDAEIVRGDLRALPFSDQEFDLVVCFEVIEHVEDREAVLDELSRVLGPTGVLCISTPNRRVYPPGNPYHVYEYEPEELAETLGKRFAAVKLFRQTACLASAILTDAQIVSVGSELEADVSIVKTDAREPGEETFTLALAAHEEIADPTSRLILGATFDVRWWEEQLERINGELDHRSRKLAAEVRRREEHGRALLTLESELAVAQNEAAALRAVHAEVEEWARETIAKETEKWQESQRTSEDFENRLRRAEGTIDDLTSSISWRITAPIRSVKRLLSRG